MDGAKGVVGVKVVKLLRVGRTLGTVKEFDQMENALEKTRNAQSVKQ